MADNNLEEILEPFNEQADEAEARLERLESDISDSGNAELETKIDELRLDLMYVKADIDEETEKTQQERQRLIAENIKLQYRIVHLERALEEADSKLLSK